jgi:hypothetical protein
VRERKRERETRVTAKDEKVREERARIAIQQMWPKNAHGHYRITDIKKDKKYVMKKILYKRQSYKTLFSFSLALHNKNVECLFT